RVLLSKAPILLFDEPTSALDPQNAELFFQLLSQDPRTRILITHDLASLCHADTVILLEEGQIIAQGTHQQLSEHTPQYQQL
ncbi:ABC transporter ATP-binding protein, partial [Escherichia coli]